MFISETLKSFSQIRTEFDIPSEDFFKYLQIRHFLESLIKQNKFRFNLSELEETIMSVN